MYHQYFHARELAESFTNAVHRSTGIMPMITADDLAGGYYVDVPQAGGKGEIVLDAFLCGVMAAKEFKRQET